MLNPLGTKSHKLDDADFPQMMPGVIEGAIVSVIIVICVIIYLF